MEIKYDSSVWFSPRYAITNLFALIKSEGDIVKQSNDYQKEREAWVVGITLLGIRKIYGELWWLQIPVEDPPDILAMTLAADKNKNQNTLVRRLVEAMEFTDYSRGTLVEEVLRKLKNKAYQRETVLVIYLRKNFSISVKKLSDELTKKNLNVADVWIMGNTSFGADEFIVSSLFPKLETVKFKLNDEIEQLPPGNTIYLSFGKGVKERVALPITRFNPKGIKQMSIV